MSVYDVPDFSIEDQFDPDGIGEEAPEGPGRAPVTNLATDEYRAQVGPHADYDTRQTALEKVGSAIRSFSVTHNLVEYATRAEHGGYTPHNFHTPEAINDFAERWGANEFDERTRELFLDETTDSESLEEANAKAQGFLRQMEDREALMDRGALWAIAAATPAVLLDPLTLATLPVGVGRGALQGALRFGAIAGAEAGAVALNQGLDSTREVLTATLIGGVLGGGLGKLFSSLDARAARKATEDLAAVRREVAELPDETLARMTDDPSVHVDVATPLETPTARAARAELDEVVELTDDIGATAAKAAEEEVGVAEGTVKLLDDVHVRAKEEFEHLRAAVKTDDGKPGAEIRMDTLRRLAKDLGVQPGRSKKAAIEAIEKRIAALETVAKSEARQASKAAKAAVDTRAEDARVARAALGLGDDGARFAPEDEAVLRRLYEESGGNAKLMAEAVRARGTQLSIKKMKDIVTRLGRDIPESCK